MIKANALRLGNWIELKNSGFIKVDADNIGDIINNPAILDPIPITPEILKKCEFKEVSGNKKWNLVFEIKGFAIIKNRRNKFYYWYGKEIYINSLHQLQNLYLALTGEELEINL